MDFIDTLAGSIVYHDLFDKNKIFENGYNLFLNNSDQNDSMRKYLLSFFQRKYENHKSNLLSFIEIEKMNLIIDGKKNCSNLFSNYYPSIINHNKIIFYGFESFYGQFWYSYYDFDEMIYIFVKNEINDIFINEYLVKNINYDQNKMYIDQLKNMNSEYVIDYGYFCLNNKELYINDLVKG